MALEVLYLIRHGKADDSHPQGDRFRALSTEGRARIAAMGPRAAAHGFRADLALSSPYLRAVQTRDLFGPVFGPARLETTTALTPEADAREVAVELRAWVAEGFTRVALFTHNPLVTQLAQLLADSHEEFSFHTPTILALAFDQGRERGRVLWTLHP